MRPVSALSRPKGLRRLYGILWEFAAGRRLVVVGYLFMLLVAQLARLLIPYFFGQAVNDVQDGSAQNLREASLDIALMCGSAFAAWALHGPGRVLERFMALRVREQFADALYAKAVSLPLRWHERHHSGDTLHRMGKATTALFGFCQSQFIYLQNAVNLLGPMVALCLVSRATGTAALVGYTVVAAVLLRIDRIMVRLVRAENEAERHHSAGLVDCLGNIATVLTLRLQEATRKLVRARYEQVSVPVRRSIVVNEVKWGAVDLLNTVLRSGLVVLYAFLSYRETGSVLVGTAVMVYQYSQQMGNVIGAMATHWGDLVRYQTDIAAADEILHAASADAQTVAIEPGWREIQISNLTCAHPRSEGGRPTLDGVSLTLRRGARVAFIGESGSGKSTLLRVLSGLHEASTIDVSVDGRAHPGLRHLGSESMLIPQDPEVFESSLAYNLTLGIEHAPDAVDRACALACLTPILNTLPQGLATPITERGLNLSGGQKQRLALARGLLASRDASIVMLDEPTSSIDPVTEGRIYDNIFAELGDRCVISAVHRLHLLPRFDCVVLLAEGRVVDAGCFEELLARQPRFQAMWQGYVADPGTAAPESRAA